MEHSNSLIPRALFTKQATSTDLSRSVNALNVMTKTSSLKSLSSDGIVIKATHVKTSDKKPTYPRKIIRRSCCLCSFKRPKRLNTKPAKKLTFYVSSKWDTGSQTKEAKVISIGSQTMKRRNSAALRAIIWLLSCLWHSLPLVAIGTWLGGYYGYIQPWKQPLKSYNTWDQILQHFQQRTQIDTNHGLATQPFRGLIFWCLFCLCLLFKKILKF